MKYKIMMLSFLLVGCASNGDLRKLEDDMTKKMKQEFQVIRTGLKEDVKSQMLADSRKELVQEMKKEVYSEIAVTIQEDRAETKKVVTSVLEKFSEHQKVIKEVIAQSLLELKQSINSEVEFALSEGDFIKALEDNIVNRLSNVSLKQLQDRKDEFVKECVNMTLEQIVVKKIGVRESQVQEIQAPANK